MLTVTETIAAFVLGTRHDEVPRPVRARSALLLADAIAIAASNADAPFVTGLSGVLRATVAPGESSVIGAPLRMAAEGAAHANSAAIHGSDLDATHIASIVHPCAIAVPVALAVGEEVDATGAEVLATIACASEALIRLGLAAGGQYHLAGFQATALLGPVVAALAAARLRGRLASAAAEAAGLATSVAAGLRSFSDDGTWGKRLITGWACRAGIHADGLVAAGYRGSRDALEKRWGLFAAFLPGRVYDLERATTGLGTGWALMATEVKRYPCSHGLHPFIDSAIALRLAAGDPGSVETVGCVVTEEARRWWFEPADARYHPDPYAARFSIPYVVARAFLDGHVDDAAFDATAVADRRVLALAAKVRPLVDEATTGAPVGLAGGLEVGLSDGRTIRIERAPDPPPPESVVRARWRTVVGRRIGEAAADDLLAKIEQLGEAASVRDLLTPLASRSGLPVG